MIRSSLVVLLIAPMILSSSLLIKQLNPSRLEQSIKTNEFTLVYFYSTTCQYCQAFTPKYEKLATIHNFTGMVLGKIDGLAYKTVTEKYGVFSYPTIALFWKQIDAPIFFLKEREIPNLLQFLGQHTKPLNNMVTTSQFNKLTEQQKMMGILYVGPVPSYEYNVTSVLSYLQPYRPFGVLDANVTKPYLQIKGEHFDNFDVQDMRKNIRRAFAFVHQIDEEGWLNIHEKKYIGIVYIDVVQNNVVKILQKLAKQFYQIVFMKIDQTQDQFIEALDFLGVQRQQNLFGIDERAKAKFVASKPYTQQSIREFIAQVLNLSAPLYMRSQKTTHPQKLTRNNFEDKVVKEAKDVVIFLYRSGDRGEAKFMDLFRHLTEKLKSNKNISLLRCNLSKNQIELQLGFEVKVTPSVIFYGNRMKDKPVHFLKSTISPESIIEFIMENTTFDWEDEWGEL